MPMPSGPTCSMNMLWNTQIEDTCIVFRSWHISTKAGFVFSCAAVVAVVLMSGRTTASAAVSTTRGSDEERKKGTRTRLARAGWL